MSGIDYAVAEGETLDASVHAHRYDYIDSSYGPLQSQSAVTGEKHARCDEQFMLRGERIKTAAESSLGLYITGEMASE
jgi:hypothetical protein